MKFSFLSSTWPEWSFAQMVSAAVRHGYEGVDLRTEWGHQHGLELESQAPARQQARRRAADAGVAIACIATSVRLARVTAAERQQEVDTVARYAELAADLGVPALRVFGGTIPEGHTMAELRPHTAEALGRAGQAAQPFGVIPCLELHDAHNNPADVAYIANQAGSGGSGGSGAPIGVVWHAKHHLRLGISVDDAYARLRGHVRHLHFEWNQPRPGGARAGTQAQPNVPGDEHIRAAMSLLIADGFDGYGAHEWIIKRHAEADPDTWLATHAAQLRAWRLDLTESE